MSEIDWPEDAIGMFSMRHAPTWPPFFVRSKEWTDFSCGEHSGGYQGEQTSGSSYHVFDKVWQFTERPTPQWSGDGLPPVGTVCEAKFTTDWVPFELLYLGTSIVVFKTSFELSRPRLDFEQSGVEFRPIRTEAQIAAEEREKAIDEMVGFMCQDGAFDHEDPEAAAAMGKLYDAGYRKQEPKP